MSLNDMGSENDVPFSDVIVSKCRSPPIGGRRLAWMARASADPYLPMNLGNSVRVIQLSILRFAGGCAQAKEAKPEKRIPKAICFLERSISYHHFLSLPGCLVLGCLEKPLPKPVIASIIVSRQFRCSKACGAAVPDPCSGDAVVIHTHSLKQSLLEFRRLCPARRLKHFLPFPFSEHFWTTSTSPHFPNTRRS
jgi:hypothetical protein